MAAGDLTVFDEAKKNISITTGGIDLELTTGFTLRLITTLPTAADATPDSADYTEVTGTNYTETALTTSWDEVAGTVTFDSSTNPSWTQHASGPTDIKAALIYDESASATTGDALCFIDMTADGGTTAISLVDGDISITFNVSGLFTLA